ncbi:hypothetical protein, partial [Elizabethkingia argenteiflava]|uniref:hypothetical protein n=1 Tax=Elizabethkingia argenteiflava TaxID=2681556 RepID=UPI001BB45D65
MFFIKRLRSRDQFFEYMWLYDDTLANNNPIIESEHYIDGYHNVGFYNSGNLNPNRYNYQNHV